MIIVGELINMSRKSVMQAWTDKDAEAIALLAKKQAEAGADYIDVNSGIAGEEAVCMEWLVDVVQRAVDLPLCIDTSQPEALEKALERVSRPPLINSVSAEKERWSNFLPLLKGVECKVVGLLTGDKGLPKNVQDRLDNTAFLMEKFLALGLSQENVFLDPCVLPVSTDSSAGATILQSLQELKKEWPETHRITGLSNISFGLPARALINKNFLVMAMGAGLDAAILDPTNAGMQQSLRASEALLGNDSYCRQYLQAFRQGALS